MRNDNFWGPTRRFYNRLFRFRRNKQGDGVIKTRHENKKYKEGVKER